MRQFLPSTYRDWRLEDSSRTYDRRTIFEYIDGAGEIFLAYDFRTLSVFRLGGSGGPSITAEIFDMGSPGDAYGVFSHSREQENSGIGSGYEYRAGLLSFWQTKYFVCLSAAPQDHETETLLSGLAREISTRMPAGGSRPLLVECLPDTGLMPETIRYFHTHTSLNAHYYLGPRNILGLGARTNCVLACYLPDSAYLLCIEYPESAVAAQYAGTGTDDIMNAVRESIPPGDSEHRNAAVVTEDRYVVVVMRTASDRRARELASACLRGAQQLTAGETSP